MGIFADIGRSNAFQIGQGVFKDVLATGAQEREGYTDALKMQELQRRTSVMESEEARRMKEDSRKQEALDKEDKWKKAPFNVKFSPLLTLHQDAEDYQQKFEAFRGMAGADEMGNTTNEGMLRAMTMIKDNPELAKQWFKPRLDALEAEIIANDKKLSQAKLVGDEESVKKFGGIRETLHTKYMIKSGELGKMILQEEKQKQGENDPSIVKTFEAAHPELVPIRGTPEYGKALQAFIESGGRPYSTFVGLTPDGKQAVVFDSRKGTVGTQPLPFSGDIQPKISPTIPTEQTTAFQQIGTLKEALNQVTENYEESFVGPIAGPVGKIRDNWGIIPDAKRAEFRSLTANLYNTIIYLRSGKQINEEEAKRLLDELPTMDVSPKAFQAKLKKFTWELNSIERGRLRQLKGAGYRNVGNAQGSPVETPSSGGVKVWNPETKSFDVRK